MSTKRAFAIPLIFVVIFLISLLSGKFILNYSSNLSREFFKDLATTRGYWGTFGAKELDKDKLIYKYYSLDNSTLIYEINSSKNVNKYSWQMKRVSSNIKDIELWHRVLEVDSSKNIISYK